MQMRSSPDGTAPPRISSSSLGSAAFRQAYGLRLAYVAGAMYQGIASPELVVAMGKGGLLGYMGTGGLKLEKVEAGIQQIQAQLRQGEAYGLNLLYQLSKPEFEERTVDLYLRYGVRFIEAAAYMRASPALVRFRLKGLRLAPDGRIESTHRILAKVSRPEVAEIFMRPAPPKLVGELLAAGKITPQEAQWSQSVPLATDLCVESDSGGHTDQGVAFALVPSFIFMRDRIVREQGYTQPLALGAAGGIGTPQAAAAAFMLGADFIMTGSINQCTVEAGTSDAVKSLLQDMDVQDTDYAPAGDMFELGAKVQALRKGLLFPGRAKKLYELYNRHNGIEDIDAKTLSLIQDKFFQRPIEEVWQETKAYHGSLRPDLIESFERNPKQKMALIFRWYFTHATRLALSGNTSQKVDYQVQTGPALGAFNQWVKGTELEDWRKRRIADIGQRIMAGAADVFSDRFTQLCR